MSKLKKNNVIKTQRLLRAGLSYRVIARFLKADIKSVWRWAHYKKEGAGDNSHLQSVGS